MADVQPLRFYRTPEDRAAGGARVMTPLQAEMIEDGRLPDPDALGSSLTRHDLAIGAGYGDAGPMALPGPDYTPSPDDVDGWPPVFQWEIDPGNPDLQSGEADVSRDGWDFAVWWQRHPAGLVYASIQALEQRDDDAGGVERHLPMGRNVVVNLVYDEQRQAVIAVYGTARDFRPFVSALRTGLGLQPPTGEHA
ncbi:MAG TPA: hypothetical protein VF159_10675 [Gemmatimonadaceae bacterium]